MKLSTRLVRLLSLVVFSAPRKVTGEAGVCPNHRLYDPISDQTYVIPDTRIGQRFTGHHICMANSRPFVALECQESGMFGAEWSVFEPNQACNYTGMTTSPITPELQDLRSLLKTEKETVSSVLNQTLEVISQQLTLSALDVVYIADIIQLTLDRPLVSAQDANTVLEIFDTIVNVEDDILQESRQTGNATNRYRLATTTRLLTETVAFEVWDLSRLGDGDLVIGLEHRVRGGAPRSRVLKSGDLFTLFENDDVDYNHTDVAIIVPAAFLRNLTEGNPGKDVRLTLGIFADTSLFWNSSLESRIPKKSDNYSTLNSKVVSARITLNGQPLSDLGGYNITTVFLPYQTLPGQYQHVRHTRCVFWNFRGAGGLASWSDEGCTFQDSQHGRDVCSFDHLTNFAVLADLYGQSELPEEHQTALSIISLIGLSLSIIGLSFTVLAFLRISKLRQGRRQKVLFNLALALLLSWVTFLAGFTRRLHVQALSCIAVAALLHYLILASFMWMLMEGVLQYLLFVKVFNAFCANYVAKTVVWAWGLPLLPVVTVLAIDPNLYHGGDKYCWMSLLPFYYAFLVPVAVIMLVNMVIYVLVVLHICRRGARTTSVGLRHNVSGSRTVGIRASFACFVVLGLSWVFAFFAVEDARVVFQYLFTISTTLQGLVICLVFTARDSHVRSVLRSLTRRSKTASSTSSSGQSLSTTNSTETGRFRSSVETQH